MVAENTIEVPVTATINFGPNGLDWGNSGGTVVPHPWSLTPWVVDTVEGFQAVPQNIEGVPFRALLAVENLRVTDGRMLRQGSIFTRTPPLPLMFVDKNTDGHQEARFVGNIMRVWRDGDEIWGEGVFDTTPHAQEAVRLVGEGRMNKVSIDTAIVEAEPEIDEDDMVIGFNINKAELLGATIVPFPAFGNTKIELLEVHDVDLAASGLPFSLEASALPQDAFDIPEPDELTPWTVDGDRVYGHLAPWGVCHIGIQDNCVVAPKSKTKYADFMIGRIEKQRIGVITLNTTHAGPGLSAREAARHYADTGTVAAYVTIHDGELGPWVSGIIEPELSDRDRRRLAACGISGDWRKNHRVNGLELVAILSVPTPGFTVPRYEDEELLVASAIGHFSDCVGCDESAKAKAELEAILEEPEEVEDTVDETLAEDIGKILDEILNGIEAQREAELLDSLIPA